MRQKITLNGTHGKRKSLEKHLLTFEKLSGLTLTVHDPNRFFVDERGNTLLGERRQSHRRSPICASSPREACRKHCVIEIGAEAASTSKDFFCHRCHMHTTEIVVPLRDDGIHCATIFAGKWKSSGGRLAEKRLTGSSARRYEELETLRPSVAEDLGQLLVVLGKGLVAQAKQEQPVLFQTRKALIRDLIRMNLSKGISLRQLASELCLSPSRTSHLVKELFGIPFSKLLNHERFLQAKRLLWTSDRSIAEIAREIGIASEFHFNRMFKRLNGCPPGKYRKISRNSVEI